MANILLWSGIILIVLGWIALAWQASIRMAAKQELIKFPEKKKIMMLRRNYCRLTILGGLLLIVVSLAL